MGGFTDQIKCCSEVTPGLCSTDETFLVVDVVLKGAGFTEVVVAISHHRHFEFLLAYHTKCWQSVTRVKFLKCLRFVL